MKVSAVVPVYNAAKYLRETLAGLLGQTEPPDEIIVVDDASNDNTVEVAAGIALTTDKIKLYRLPGNQGVSAARNFGINRAGGDWILFFDGDDLAEPSLLSQQLARAGEFKSRGVGSPVLVHSAYLQIDAAGAQISGAIRWKEVRPEETVGYLLLRNPIITASGVLARKDALNKCGGFNPRLRYSEDWDLWLRLAGRGGFGYVDEPLVLVRRHDHNSSKDLTAMLEGERRVLSQYDGETMRAAIFRRRLPWEMNAVDYASLMFRLDQWDRGYQLLEEALARNPACGSARFMMGIYNLRRQEWAEARQYFAATIAVDEGHGAAHNNLGALLAAAGAAAEARAHLRRALELFPGYLDAQRNLEFNAVPDYGELHFTWRELRKVLLHY